MTKIVGIAAILSTASISANLRNVAYRTAFGMASIAATAFGWWRVRPGAERCSSGACTVDEWRASRRLMAFATAGALLAMVAGIVARPAESRAT